MNGVGTRAYEFRRLRVVLLTLMIFLTFFTSIQSAISPPTDVLM